MYRRILPLLIFSFITVAYTDSAVQTDWSGGPGVWGPVIVFGDQFYYNTDIDCIGFPGNAILTTGTIVHPVDTTYNGASMVFSEDIDGDGYVDIVGCASYANITWWRNNDGSGTSLTEYIIGGSSGYQSVHSGDIDGDGDQDLVGSSWYGINVSWWENINGSGTSWTRHFIDNNYSSAQSAYSEDIDGDGDFDVLASSFFGGKFTWWENYDGLGTTWIEHTIDSNADGARKLHCEDIDGDGDVDILGAMDAIDDVVWWENVDGSGSVLSKHWIDSDFDMATDVHAEDIDNDGDIDVIGGGYDTSWWENLNGSGTQWTEHSVTNARSFYVYSDDIDGDGDNDILVASGGNLVWWENADGMGTMWAEHIVFLFGGANSVYSEDINGDGNQDILGTAYEPDDVVWCNLNAYIGGSLESSCLYLQSDPGWGSIDWTAVEPSGSTVSFQVRSCDSPDMAGMGIWSDTLYTPGSLQGILSEGDSYFQYRAILQTDETSVTPILEDVTVTWNSLGIGEGELIIPGLLPFSPNPASTPTVRFGLPEPASVEISIFDLSGRFVNEIQGNEYSSGYHDVLLGDMSPGIYFCRMISGDFTATQRFVVIE